MFCLYDLWDVIGIADAKKLLIELLEISVMAAYIVQVALSVNEGGNISKVKCVQIRSRWGLSMVLCNIFCFNICGKFIAAMINSSLCSKADRVNFSW